MNSFKSSSTLKAETRELLLGKYRYFILILLLMEAIVTIPAFAVSLSGRLSVTGFIVTLILVLVLEFITAILGVGYNYFSLNVGLNRPYRVGNLFYGFTYRTGQIILIQLLLVLLNLAVLLPVIILYAVLVTLLPSAKVILTAVAVVAAVYGMLFITLRYHFVFYIILDYPDATIKDIFRFSAGLMKGNCLRLLYLYVSFLPYYLLVFCSMGIGLLFVGPYQKMTVTKFYMDLIDCYYRKPSAEVIE